MQSDKRIVTWTEVYERISKLPDDCKLYGIPRGGAVIAGLTGLATDDIDEADYIVDDIIDSGATAKRYMDKHQKTVIGLFNKIEEGFQEWLVFPWELEDTNKDIQDTIIRQLEFIGEDPTREGLLETPRRVVKSWKKLFEGYDKDPKEILSTVFTQKYDEMVLLKDIELYSTCEHHMIPFVGKCHIAYIPDGKVVGLSKLARLMECFTRRLQIQEKLTNQIVDAIDEHLKPKGVACIIEAKHFCMCSRGVEKQNSSMVTSALRGVFHEPEARQEFMGLIR